MSNTSTKYRVYYVSEDGLLKEPKESGYGYDTCRFSSYDSREDAEIAIGKEDSHNDYVILPVTSKDWEF